MLESNIACLNKHRDILSFLDLAKSTVAAYIPYLTIYIECVEEQIPEHLLSSVTWEEIRSDVIWLKDVRGLKSRTINVHIAQTRDFSYYVLHKVWDKWEIPYLHFDQFLPNVPTKEQVNAIIDSISDPKHKAEIALLYSSCIRASEIFRLHCGDIVRSKNCIYIARSKNRSERYAVLSDKAYGLLISRLFAKEWIPFIGETFNGRRSAIRYLARYSFRTAIAISRIMAVTDTHVTFRYKDCADGSREKTLTVRGTDSIGMFLHHVLFRGFNRVRFSGYLTNRRKTKNLKLIHQLRCSVYIGNTYRKMCITELILTLYGRDICT